jgi:hypothetical protein
MFNVLMKGDQMRSDRFDELATGDTPDMAHLVGWQTMSTGLGRRRRYARCSHLANAENRAL